MRHLLAVLALAIGLSAYYRVGNATPTQILHLAIAEDVETFDPALAKSPSAIQVLSKIHETLYEFAFSNSEKAHPLLADSEPMVSKDGLEIKIPIRPGVNYQSQPGLAQSKVTAHDFVLAFKRLADPALASPGWWIFEGKIVGLNSFRKALEHAKNAEEREVIYQRPIAGLRATQPYLLEMRLHRPYPQLVFALTSLFTAPISSDFYRKFHDPKGKLTRSPVGTGPFKLASWEPGQTVVLQRNTQYHADFFPTEPYSHLAAKPLPFLEQIELKIIQDNDTLWDRFFHHQIDVLSGVRAAPRSKNGSSMITSAGPNAFLQKSNLKLLTDEGSVFYFLTLNMEDRILGKNKLLRQALSSAFDRTKWIEVAASGLGKKQNAVLPSWMSGYPRQNNIRYDFSIDRTKELLKAAGYPNGDGLPLMKVLMNGNDQLSHHIGAFIVESLDQVHIPAQVSYYTQKDFQKKLQDRDFQILYSGWQLDYPDARSAFRLLYGPNKSEGPNHSCFDQQSFNALYEKMVLLKSGVERSAIIQKMDSIVQEEVPIVLGYYHYSYALLHPWVENFSPNQFLSDPLKFVRINPNRLDAGASNL